MSETYSERIRRIQHRMCAECKNRRAQRDNNLCNECWDAFRNKTEDRYAMFHKVWMKPPIL